MKNKLHIILSQCRRCKKPLATANKSIWSANKTKQKYELICENCITSTEKKEMEMEISNTIFQNI